MPGWLAGAKPVVGCRIAQARRTRRSGQAVGSVAAALDRGSADPCSSATRTHAPTRNRGPPPDCPQNEKDRDATRSFVRSFNHLALREKHLHMHCSPTVAEHRTDRQPHFEGWGCCARPEPRSPLRMASPAAPRASARARCVPCSPDGSGRWRCRWTAHRITAIGRQVVVGIGPPARRCRPSPAACWCARCWAVPVASGVVSRRVTIGSRRGCTPSSAICSGSVTRRGRGGSRRRWSSSWSGWRR